MSIGLRYQDIVNTMGNHTFHILGCGAIGSSTATQLARMNASTFHLYDMDKVETHNIGVSQYINDDIGKYKVDALKSHILSINSNASVGVAPRRFEEGFNYEDNNDIVILGFDSMKSRMDAVRVICSNKHTIPVAIIDGRMGAEHFQQYIIKNPTINKYTQIWYTDEEGSPEPCTAKATSYCSNLAGSFIVNGVRKLITGQPYNSEFSINLPTLMVEKSRLIS